MDLILKGILTGFILSIMPGPVFFVLLETSIRKGIKSALSFDLGVLLNDVLYIFIAFVFYNQVRDLGSHDGGFVLKLIGGVLFSFYGVYYFFFKKVDESDLDPNIETGTSAKNYLFNFIKGFLLNLANPMVVFYWFSVLTLIDQQSDGEIASSTMVFISSILITFFSIDLLKIIGAKKLRPLLNPGLLKGLNRLIGIIFVLFGVILIAQGIIGK